MISVNPSFIRFLAQFAGNVVDGRELQGVSYERLRTFEGKLAAVGGGEGELGEEGRKETKYFSHIPVESRVVRPR